MPLRVVFFGTPAFAVPTLARARRLAPRTSSPSSRSRIGRAAAGRRSRPRPSRSLARRARTARPAAGAARRIDALLRSLARVRPGPRRRRRLRPDPAAAELLDAAAARLHQRARVAAAALARRGAGPPRDPRRRRDDRRDDHARRARARCRTDARDARTTESARTKRAPSSSRVWRRSAPSCSSRTVDRLAGGPGRRRAPQDEHARDLRRAARAAREPDRLGAARDGRAQPDSRPPAVAARRRRCCADAAMLLHRVRQWLRPPAVNGPTPVHDRRRSSRTALSSRRARARFAFARSSPKAGRRCPSRDFLNGHRVVARRHRFAPLPVRRHDAPPASRPRACCWRSSAARRRSPPSSSGRAATSTDARDRALLLELAAGTLRWQHELDALLAASAGAPLGVARRRTCAPSCASARISSAISTACPCMPSSTNRSRSRAQLGRMRARRLRQRRASRTLREADRRAACRPARRPRDGRDERARVSVQRRCRIPQWLVARWLDRYGFDAAEAWCQFNNTPPDRDGAVAARLGAGRAASRRSPSAGVDASTRAVSSPDAIRLAPGVARPAASRSWRDALVVQDEASQIVAHAVGARPGERVLDVCAAPGGKTLHAGRRPAPVTACSSPATIRPRACQRCSARRSTRARRRGPRALARRRRSRCPSAPIFDRRARRRAVLRPRHAPARSRSEVVASAWTTCRASPAAASEDAGQRRGRSSRPGGRLVYATCSSEPEENDDVVDRFLGAAHSEFAPSRRTVAGRGRCAPRSSTRAASCTRCPFAARPGRLLCRGVGPARARQYTFVRLMPSDSPGRAPVPPDACGRAGRFCSLLAGGARRDVRRLLPRRRCASRLARARSKCPTCAASRSPRRTTTLRTPGWSSKVDSSPRRSEGPGRSRPLAGARRRHRPPTAARRPRPRQRRPARSRRLRGRRHSPSGRPRSC